MVLPLFLELLAIVALFLFVRHRRKIIWPIFSFMLCAIVFWGYYNNYGFISVESDSLQLLSYYNLKSNLIISSGVDIQEIIKILFPALLGLLWFNIFSKQEEYALTLSNIMILAFATVIFMVSSQDVIQLMVGSCCFSILGFYLTKDILGGNKFLFYNFFSEFSLFTAITIMYSQVKDIAVPFQINMLEQIEYKNLISILVMLAVLIKCATFLFQDQIFELSRLNYGRIWTIFLLGTPLSGLIIYNKLYYVIHISNFSHFTLQLVVCLSIIWGLWNFLRQSEHKIQILLLDMMFFALSLIVMKPNYNSFVQIISLITLLFVCNWWHTLPTMKKNNWQIIISSLFPLMFLTSLQFASYNKEKLLLVIVYVCCIIVRLIISKFISAEITTYSQISITTKVYDTLIVAPLSLLGRILWLAVDFIVIERSLIGTISSLTKKTTGILNKYQETRWKNWIIFFILGLGLILFNIGNYIYE